MFTFNRTDYTASDLNTVFSNIVSTIAPNLSPELRVNPINNALFDDLDFTDGTTDAMSVNRPNDVVRFVAETAMTCGFNGVWSATGVSNSENTLSIRTRPVRPSFQKEFSFEEYVDIQKRILEVQFRYNEQEYNHVYNSYINSAWYSRQQNIRKDIESRQTYKQYSNYSRTVRPKGTGSTFYLETRFVLTGLTYNSTLSDLSYSSYKFRTGTKLGWPQVNVISKETFDGLGYDQWAIGAATTITMESNWLGTGFNQWHLGTNYAIGNAETFDSFDWGQGTTPSRSNSTSLKTTNLTSQIDGITNTFTMPEEYTTGSLKVYFNGQRQIVGVDVTELSSTTFSLSFVPSSPDMLNVDYNSSTSCT